MKKKLIIMAGLLLISLNVFADDVSIDSSGNVKTGVANSNAELEVTGGSGEGGILGTTSGTGASGVYGVNTSYGDYGILGYYGSGVYGYSSSGWAGYFQGNARVTGNLTVDGSITGTLSETDPQVGTLTNGMWCTSNGSLVNCETAAPLTSETDPQVGTITTNYVPKWDGSALVTGTIYDNGNIGVGTAAPASKLTVSGTIESTSGGIKFPDSTVQTSASNLQGVTGSTNSFYGQNADNGTTSGNNNTAIGAYALGYNTTGSCNIAIGYGAKTYTGDLTNATAIGYGTYVYASNTVVIGNSSVSSIGGYASWSNFSDRRTKTDIQDIGYGLDLIRQLRPVSFRMKNGNGNTDFGFVAQDIESLLGEKYNVLDIGGGDERMLYLRYTQFIAPMVKAMQEQQAQIEAQQEQIDELKAMVEELKKRL